MENIMKTIICDSIELTNISRSRLFDLISSVSDNMPIEKIAEIAYYLQGKVDADTLPETISHSDYPNAKLEEYNFFKDMVKFSYDHTSVRFFETEEDAKKYSEKGSGWGSCDPNERKRFEGVYTSRYTAEMSKHRWLNNGKY